VFTVPFNVNNLVDDSSEDDLKLMGWGILKLLQEAGFSDAKACTFWSEEFGYLGPLNFIFAAIR
jgi:hypothetical protein